MINLICYGNSNSGFVLCCYSLFSDLRSLAGTTLMNLLAALFMVQLLFIVGVGGVHVSLSIIYINYYYITKLTGQLCIYTLRVNSLYTYPNFYFKIDHYTYTWYYRHAHICIYIDNAFVLNFTMYKSVYISNIPWS